MIDRCDGISTQNMDRFACRLRSQIMVLHRMLETVEQTNQYDDSFIQESLKSTEFELRRLRKSLSLL